MDIEQLIKEEKKTQEILKRIEKAGTLEKFLEDLDEQAVDAWTWAPNTNTWDYDGLESFRQYAIGRMLRDAVKMLQEVKFLTSFMDKFYQQEMKQWEDYKVACEKHRNKKKWDWTVMYSNPDCINFFDKYEKEHGITDSLNIRAKDLRETNESN